MNSSNDRISYRVAKTHTMPQIAGHFPQKSIFCKRDTNYHAILQKMTCNNEASYASSPPSIYYLVCKSQANQAANEED